MTAEARHPLSGLPQSPLLPFAILIPQTDCHLQFIILLMLSFFLGYGRK